jgi:hypothetical protein
VLLLCPSEGPSSLPQAVSLNQSLAQGTPGVCGTWPATRCLEVAWLGRGRYTCASGCARSLHQLYPIPEHAGWVPHSGLAVSWAWVCPKGDPGRSPGRSPLQGEVFAALLLSFLPLVPFGGFSFVTDL